MGGSELARVHHATVIKFTFPLTCVPTSHNRHRDREIESNLDLIHFESPFLLRLGSVVLLMFVLVLHSWCDPDTFEDPATIKKPDGKQIVSISFYRVIAGCCLDKIVKLID